MAARNRLRHRIRLSGQRLDERRLLAGDFVGAFAEQTAVLADLNTDPAPVEFHALSQDGDTVHFAFVDSAGDVQVWKTDWNRESEAASANSSKIVHIRDANAGRVQQLYPYKDGFLLPIERWQGQPYGPGHLELRYIDATNNTSTVIKDLGPTFQTEAFEWEPMLRWIQFSEIGGELLIKLSIDNPRHDGSVTEIYHSDRLERPFARLSNPTAFTELNGKAYFFSDPGNDRVSFVLHEIDPINQSIRRVTTMPNSGFDLPRGPRVVGDRLYFTYSAGLETQVWTSDGTAEGTMPLAEFSVRNLASIAASFTKVDGELLFAVNRDIWTTDGTIEGTRELPEDDPRSLNVLTKLGLVDRERPLMTDDSNWESIGFTKVQNIDGELWVQSIDESSINLGPDFTVVGQQYSSPVVSDGQQFFRVQYSSLGLTPMFPAGIGASQPLNINVLETPTVVTEGANVASDLQVIGQSQGELLISDGRQLFELAPESPLSLTAIPDTEFVSGRTDDSGVLSVTIADSGVYFIDKADGYLWRRSHDDGTLEQLTTSDHRFNSNSRCNSCAPYWLAAVAESDGRIVSIARDNIYIVDPSGAVEPVFADGFAPTEFEINFDERYGNKGERPFIFAHDEYVYWGIKNQINQIGQLGEDGPVASHLGALDYYLEMDNTKLNETLLVKTDSIANELVAIGDPDFTLSNVYAMTRSEDRVVFLRANQNQLEMWETDGTTAGTEAFATINDVQIEPDSFGYVPADMVDLGSGVFVFNDGFGQLIRSDGTAAGTEVLKEFDVGIERSGSEPNATRDFVVNRGQAFFVAHHPEFGREIWVTDGTPEGTQIAVDLRLGPQSSLPDQLNIWNNTLYFVADAGDEVGREIWTIDLNEPEVEADEPRADSSADIDGDGIVGFSDFLLLSAAFGQESPDPNPADIDRDGVVDFSDFLILNAAISALA